MMLKPSSLFVFAIICLLPLCSADSGTSTCPEENKIGTLDSIIYLVGGTCAAFLSFFLIIGFIIYPPLRRQPGDLIVVLSSADFIISIFWIIGAVRNDVDDQSFTCIFLGALPTYAAFITVTYNFSFCFYLISVLKHSLKHANIPKKRLHIIPLTLVTILIVYFLATNSFGKTYGSCSLKRSEGWTAYFGVTIILAYIVLAFVTQSYIKKSSPDCEKINTVKKDFLLYYTGMLTATSIMWSVILATSFLITLHEQDVIPGCWVPEYIRPLSIIARIASPFVLSIFRYRDRFVGKYMAKLFFCFNRDAYKSPLKEPLKGSKKGTDDSAISLEMSEMSQEGTISTEENGAENQSIRRSNSLDDDDRGIAALAKSLRYQIIYTMLCGIVYSDKVLKAKNLPKIEVDLEEQSYEKDGKIMTVKKRKNSDIYKNFTQYQLGNQVIQKELPEYFKKLQAKKYDILSGNLTFYCENIFSELRQQDQAFLDVQESLDVDANEDKVQKAGEGRGGKSGEFFFFSYDNKLIIKTMTSEELGVLLGILERYHKHHLYDNPKSLIAKIYGVFSFQRENDPDPVHLIMMRNVNGWPGSCVVRKYDLKGSTFARKVEKRKDATKDTLDPDETYKDIDFINYDQKFFIQEALKPKILEIIRKDVQFFHACGIIDYSLAVYILDKSKARKKSEIQEEEKNHHAEGGMNGKQSIAPSKKPKAEEFNEFYSMQSVEEPRLCYNMGIIDYLQLYTFQKMTEKYCKRILNCNSKLDTSSKNPEKYSTRFLEFAAKVFS